MLLTNGRLVTRALPAMALLVMAVQGVAPAVAAPGGAAPGTGPGSLAARGEYVAVTADCESCHSAPGGRPYAGGYPLKSPLGIIYSPNITQDVKTGIGGWTRADFERALRAGRSKDGSYLYPAMPYDDYTKMTAADMDALWAYMRTVRAVQNTPPKNTLPFPFTVRSGLAVWQSVYFKPGPFHPDPTKTAGWNRGAYLVQVMGHCNQCHTPRNLAQALEPQHALGGATIEGWYAPDISNDSGSQINQWSTDQLARFLKVGTTPDNAKVVGPMQEAVHTSLSKMTTADLRDIAVYLKDQPPIQKPETPTKANWAANRQADGKLVYENNCSGCHQGNGQGIQGTVPALANDGAVTAAEPYNVIMALLEGFAPHGSWGAMASFANTLNDDQIADVTNYVRTAWGNTAPANATPWGVSSWRKTADVAKNESHALLCPNLTSDVVQPALNAGPNALKMAASDGTEMSKLIGDYRTARPKTSTAELIEALSTAYCRVLAADRVSSATMSVELADFTQRVATAVNPRKTSS